MTDDALRGGAPAAGSAPRSSCSTAATPAPAAATTSCSAGRRRPTARSCAGPICCAAWSATGINHPSLSYLFSRPVRRPDQPGAARRRGAQRRRLRAGDRVRAGRRDRGRRSPPWLVDRIFRHLLVDVTGNTHRTEFCIDKLYTPDSAVGPAGPGRAARLRDAAARADEPRAAAAGARAGRRGSGRTPYRRKLVRWGTELHDRFMLPHFVAQDFEDVLADLRGAGYPLRAEWFAPHFEFRFPLLGAIASSRHRARAAPGDRAVARARRGAGAAAARPATSIRRSSAAGQGARADRPAPRRRRATAGACRCTRPGTPGEFVAGVRYRAWQPAVGAAPDDRRPRAAGVRRRRHLERPLDRRLHATTCRIPGGLAYEHFPVNAHEAEGAAHRALLPVRPHARPDGGAARGAQPRLPADARPAVHAAQVAGRGAHVLDGVPSAQASGADRRDRERRRRLAIASSGPARSDHISPGWGSGGAPRSWSWPSLRWSGARRNRSKEGEATMRRSSGI